MKRERSEAQRAGDARRCLNGERAMTQEERKARRAIYKAAVKADPFRRKLYAEYFKKRRKRPGVRERTNEQARARYAKDIERSRSYCREKYRRYRDDPEKHAAMLERRRKTRKMTNAEKRSRIKNRLIPHWERVVFEGREDAYLRRASAENARLFKMWKTNLALFEQMIEWKGGAK